MFKSQGFLDRDSLCVCILVCLYVCVCMFQSEGFLDRKSESDADRVRGEGAKAMLVACLRRLHRSGDCNSSRG